MSTYQFKLSDQFQTLAKEELCEDEAAREKTLPLLREWIEANLFINKCRTDDRFLLKFLRFCMFDYQAAGWAIEQYLVARQKLSDWFKYSDPCDPAIVEILNDAPLVVLGRDMFFTVLLVRLGRFNVDKLTYPLLMGLIMMFLEVLLDEEEVQIGGLRVWLDFTNVSPSFFPLLKPTEMKSMMEVLTQTMPVHIWDVHVVSLPKCATFRAKLAMHYIDWELSERIKCHKTPEEAKKHMPKALWPEEYGGSIDTAELNRQFRRKMERRRDSLQRMDDKLEIDVSKFTTIFNKNVVHHMMEEIESGVMGIYRKLSIE